MVVGCAIRAGSLKKNKKLSVLSNAPCLRFHENYKNVYIAPDMTKLERAKHKKLVDELKRRR